MNKKEEMAIHTALIKINGVREKICLEISELEHMRKGINERQRANLEMKISNRKLWVKELNDIELEFREEL
jgi:hypothetical protein